MAELLQNDSTMSESNLDACRCNDMSVKDYSDSYAIYNAIVAMVALPTVAVFGMFSNMANIFIFTRPAFISSPSNIFLLSLSCSDFLTVLTGVFLFCSDSARVYLPSLTRVATEGVIYILPLGYIAQTCSVYFTLAAAVDCYAKVCLRRTDGSPISCSTVGAKAASFFVALFSLAYNFPRFWQFELHNCYDGGMNRTNTEVCPTVLYHDIEVVYNVYMYMILMTALPFISLSVLNVLIIRRVHTKRRKFSHDRASLPAIDRGLEPLTNSHNSIAQMCARNRNSITGSTAGDDGVITMVMVVVMFLACNTLALVVNIVETFFDPDVLVVQFMTDTSNLLVVFNSSVNFVIYMLCDKAYAGEFSRWFCCNHSSAMKMITRIDKNMNAESVHEMNYEFTKNRNGNHAEGHVSRSVSLCARRSLAECKPKRPDHVPIKRKLLSLPPWQPDARGCSNGDLTDAIPVKLPNEIMEKQKPDA